MKPPEGPAERRWRRKQEQGEREAREALGEIERIGRAVFGYPERRRRPKPHKDRPTGG